MTERAHLLIVDDEDGVRRLLADVLEDSGHEISSVPDAKAALALARERPIDVALVDLNLPLMNGVELMGALKSIQPALQVLVVTGGPSIDAAVGAMKAGAFDFLAKPVHADRLLLTVRNAAAMAVKDRELARLRSSARGAGFAAILGDSPSMRKAVALAERVAPSDAAILLSGESGTGKELFAKAIHAASARAPAPLVAVNCAAIAPTLAESELFGHEPGAFTGATGRRVGKFEEADGGTLFLDEIEAMPPELQAKILRVLQEKSATRVGGGKPFKADARIVAATNRDLEKMVGEGKFREDLFFRVAGVQVHIPPLRERPEDLPLLAEHLMREAAAREGKAVRGWSPESMRLLVQHAWPGNVRELQNVSTHAALVCDGELVGPEHLPLRLAKGGQAVGPRFEDAVEALERWMIADALKRAGGVQARAAELLGSTKRIINYKIAKYGLGKGEPDDTKT